MSEKEKQKPKRPRCPSCGYGIHNYYDFQTKAECKPCGKMLEELMEALDIKPQK